MMMVIRLRLALILAAGTTTVAALSLAPPDSPPALPS